uniref:PI-PLC Y-box domain-containing protein n=1 Tax=Neobodo designis TaxID=312471 RepID=A0A7S1QY82_NEODS|mmetsp:Transcript_54590/g.168089  ORF Transcript_54590/g.168089 Transcript_54590/m.168089 type:complete len:804 (+) Transcript_54590:110-2521(+)|eukprot:CAMPEP_0174848960 /NCGR_PEP_ID=MMETSP1114-20130205/13823_1 /TAXON_ID=312471 /ORGANISM="Neobodo designis, Strain CCAP 1951/1" /LENGTH=803 /DNA_ID=CAMNT_0016083265 /DNA_START=106 /DNA_END=2517 /DNA_ORIENTATION=-
MGCKQSKDRRTDDSQPDDAGDEPPELSQAEGLVKATAVSTWEFLKSVSFGKALEADWLAYVSTGECVMDRNFSATRIERRKALELLRKICPAAPEVEPEKVVDDRMHSLFEAWTAVVEDGRDHVPRSKVADVLARAKVTCAIPDKLKSFTFGDLLRLAYDAAQQTGLGQLFDDAAQGAEILTVEQLATFASFGADEPMSVEEARDKISKRLGGAVTRLRFLLFFGNSATNDVLDPKRALSVWQDMSQPLTHYSVATRSVSTMAEMKKALTAGCRALVMHVSHVNKEGDPMMKDGKSLQALLHFLKEHAFITNPLPVVLCFLPGSSLTVEMQDAVANALTSELSETLAPGLMFRGSHISDPKFTPLGLQHRFLVMAQQGALKPFVGFNVANMQRTGLGVRVTAVPEGTPAARAGIGKQDWLTHFNGEVIESKETLREKLLSLHAGEEFRVRKEGLTEVTGIVGASVAENPTISKKFAELLFLNFVGPTAHEGASGNAANGDHESGDSPAGQLAALPWDTQLEELPVHGGSLSPERCHGSPLTLDTARANSPNFEHTEHFRFVSRAAVGTADTDERERVIADADLAGVQFIDTQSSPAAERWARGKFSDNGHCGYVLQPRLPSSRSSEAHGGITPFASDAPRVSVVRYDHDDPARVHLDIELLAMPGQNANSKTHPAHDPACAVALIGTPERTRAPLLGHGTIDVREPAGKVVLLRTVDAEGNDLEAALPANLVRSGYRIITFCKHDDPTVAVPVLCAVRRHETITPSISHGGESGTPTDASAPPAASTAPPAPAEEASEEGAPA